MCALKDIVVSNVTWMLMKSTCDENDIDENICLMDVV